MCNSCHFLNKSDAKIFIHLNFDKNLPFFLVFVELIILREKNHEHYFVYQKALIRTFHTSFFYNKTTYVKSQHENTNSKGLFCNKKSRV